VHVAQRFERLRDETEKDVTIAALAEELELDKSAVWRRVRSAMDRGYLDNKEDRKGRPAKLVTTDALPDDIEILPASERWRMSVPANRAGLAFRAVLSEGDAKIFELTKA
jgi:IS5 family transposase